MCDRANAWDAFYGQGFISLTIKKSGVIVFETGQSKVKLAGLDSGEVVREAQKRDHLFVYGTGSWAAGPVRIVRKPEYGANTDLLVECKQ